MIVGYVSFLCLLTSSIIESAAVEQPDVRSNETILISHLLNGYQRMARPVLSPTTAVNVSIGVTLMKIGVHLENDQIALETWIKMEWTDEGLRWNPDEYGGSLKAIRLDPDSIWTPDVVPYNMDAQYLGNWMKKTRVVIYDNGEIMYVSPATILVTCKRDIIITPTDLSCDVKLGSWVYSGLELNLTLQSNEVDLSSYVTNSMWSLQNAELERNSILYACCPEPYIDVTMNLRLRARGAIKQLSRMPSVVASVLMLAAFSLPVTSTNRLGLATFSLALSLISALLQYGAGQAGSSETFYMVMWLHQVNCYWLLLVFLVHVIVAALANLKHHTRYVPQCLQTLLFSRMLSCVCCLSRGESNNSTDVEGQKEQVEESKVWLRVAGTINRVFGIFFFALLIISILQASLF